jgi:pyruvate kinase
VPLVQKRIIAVANALGRPVITATQMLESMIQHPRPTRAEASDVANAILDGSDAVMLSGETAVGRHPLEAVRTIVRVAEELASQGATEAQVERRRNWSLPRVDSPPEAIGAAVAAVARSLPGITAIWVITRFGSSARLVSCHRPGVPILAFTPEERTWRRLSLLWGVTPVLCELVHDQESLERAVTTAARQQGLARPGDTVVLTGSHPFGESAETNFLKIQRL